MASHLHRLGLISCYADIFELPASVLEDAMIMAQAEEQMAPLQALPSLEGRSRRRG